MNFLMHLRIGEMTRNDGRMYSTGFMSILEMFLGYSDTFL